MCLSELRFFFTFHENTFLHSFDENQIQRILARSISDIMCDNTDLKSLPRKLFQLGSQVHVQYVTYVEYDVNLPRIWKIPFSSVGTVTGSGFLWTVWLGKLEQLSLLCKDFSKYTYSISCYLTGNPLRQPRPFERQGPHQVRLQRGQGNGISAGEEDHARRFGSQECVAWRWTCCKCKIHLVVFY